jgi:hypothetical protein
MTTLSPLTAQYRQVLLPEDPSTEDLRALAEPYQALIATQFQTILARAEHSSTYPWLDTKINLLTGEDYPAGDPLFGHDLVSGWVQGRGLEALVGFAGWLASYSGDAAVDDVLARVRSLVAALLARLRSVRQKNGGHVHFYMTPEGRAFVFGPDRTRQALSLAAGAPYNYSDLFTAKGMYAAAHFLGDAEAVTEARSYCLAVYNAIDDGSFASDQPEPPTVAKAWIPGVRSHGPHMIAQGMAALFAAYEPGPLAAEMGLTLSRYVWRYHVNVGERWTQLREFDVVEYLDAGGRPYMDDGKVISDPGHALEYAGLFLKLQSVMLRYGGASAGQQATMAAIAERMPAYLARNFANGFQSATGGICKTVDLLTRRPVDDTLPWWSLPETIRAALSCWKVAASAAERQACLAIVARCHNAFVSHYVQPQAYLMAVKVRAADGRPLDIVPVYPDADPGYHTALSLIDALACLAPVYSS